MLIVQSQSLDVYRNLAIEEYLMEYAMDAGPVLFLWRSDCAVVMGKNQNPWRECRLDLMRNDRIPLARRISGGGTVYHDVGNLNYCVIVDRRQYREQQAYELVVRALEQFDIQAERTGKSNLSVGGLKFSGNAFCFRKNRAMHHGTLLLDTDLERLGLYLGPLFTGIETHAIRSVPAQVMNLKLGVNELSEVLKNSFFRLYGSGASEPASWSEHDMDHMELQSLVEHQESEGWRYGATPAFSLEIQGLRLDVAKGRVLKAHGPHIASMSRDWVGLPFSEVAFSLLC